MKILPWVSIILLLGGCARREPPRATTPEPVSGLDDEAWRSALLEHREQRDEELRTSATSPMAAAQYLRSEPGDMVWVTRKDRTFALADSPVPGAVLMVTKEDGSWHWHDQGLGVVCRVEEQELPDGSALPGPATFTVESFRLGFYPDEDRVTFRVFDPERPEMKAFGHLLYFPPDRRYALRAQLVALPEPEQVEMLTSRNLEKVLYRCATIRFRLDEKELKLSAFKFALTGEDSETLFVPFRDLTSGRESYGAGRFLELDEPDDESFVLDFNRCFNPLCNYSPAYNCTIPPRENHLEVAIRAGERTYPH